MEMSTALIIIVSAIVVVIAGSMWSAHNRKKDHKVTFLVDKEGNFMGYKLPDVVDNLDLKKITEP